MDEPWSVEDDERAADALVALRRALDAAAPDDCAFVVEQLGDLVRRLDVQRPV
jgi:hypothetical protein